MRFSTKTYAYIFEQIKERSDRGKENHAFLAAFADSNFSYRKALKNAGLFEGKTTAEIFPLEKGTKKTIALTALKGLSMYGSAGNYFGGFTDFGIREVKKEAEKFSDSYSIYLSKSNDIAVRVSFESVYRSSDLPMNCVERELSFLNLPLFFYNLINEPRYTEKKLELAAVLEKNSTSTLANVFAYVSANSEEIAGIPQLIGTIDGKIQENSAIYYSDSFNNILDGRKIGKFRVEKTSLVRIPYYIYKDQETITLQLNVGIKNYDLEAFEAGWDFPVLVTLKAGQITPVFMLGPEFEKLKNSYQLGVVIAEDGKRTVSLLEKTQELLLAETSSAKGINRGLNKFGWNRSWREAKIKRTLEKNSELVVTQLVKYLQATAEIDASYRKQLEDVQKIKTNMEVLEEKTQVLVKLLQRIYKKEILLKSL